MVLILLLALWLPNTQQIMGRFKPAFDTYRGEGAAGGGERWWQWRLSRPWALFSAAVALIATLHLNRVSEFLYFQF